MNQKLALIPSFLSHLFFLSCKINTMTQLNETAIFICYTHQSNLIYTAKSTSGVVPNCQEFIRNVVASWVFWCPIIYATAIRTCHSNTLMLLSMHMSEGCVFCLSMHVLISSCRYSPNGHINFFSNFLSLFQTNHPDFSCFCIIYYLGTMLHLSDPFAVLYF